jgi:hypothetical protein
MSANSNSAEKQKVVNETAAKVIAMSQICDVVLPATSLNPHGVAE